MAVVDLGDDIGGGPDGRLARLLGVERAGGERVRGERFVGGGDLRQDRGLREDGRHFYRTPAPVWRLTVIAKVYGFSRVSPDIPLFRLLAGGVSPARRTVVSRKVVSRK